MEGTSIAKEFVELYLGDGVLDGVHIEFGEMSFQRTLGYVNMPFKVRMCKKYGHLKYSCLEREEEEPLDKLCIYHMQCMVEAPLGVIGNNSWLPTVFHTGVSVAGYHFQLNI